MAPIEKRLIITFQINPRNKNNNFPKTTIRVLMITTIIIKNTIPILVKIFKSHNF